MIMPRVFARGNPLAGLPTVHVAIVSVKGVDDGGNSAVASGDTLYHVAADTPPVSKKASGIAVGRALGTVSSGATASIPVVIM
jgi:hypothetical protein